MELKITSARVARKCLMSKITYFIAKTEKIVSTRVVEKYAVFGILILRLEIKKNRVHAGGRKMANSLSLNTDFMA